MKQDFIIGNLLFLFMIIVIATYSLIIYAVGHTLWPHKASGSLILDKDGIVRGSYLLSQNFNQKKYFYGRPKLIFKDQCNVALYNKEFWDKLLLPAQNKSIINNIIMVVPSNSMLDPYITKDEAMIQAIQLSKIRTMPLQTLKEIIDNHVLTASWPFFVLDIVNVTTLNSMLDD